MRLFIFIFFCVGITSVSFAQCENRVELGKIVYADETDKGAIEIVIKSTDDYSCQLLAYRGAEKKLVEERNGKGDDKIKFENLEGEFAYRVIVRFNTEDFLCSNKVIDNIILNEKQL